MRIRRKLLLSVTGIVALAGFLLASMPAAFPFRFISVPDSVSVGRLKGSLWSGEAAWVQVQNILLPTLSWQVKPVALLERAVEVKFKTGNQHAHLLSSGDIKLTRSSLTLTDSDTDISLSWLGSLPGSQMPAGIAVDGYLKVMIGEAEFSRGGCRRVQGSFTVRGVTVNTPFGISFPVDALQGALSCADGRVIADYELDSGVVESHGQLRLAMDGRYTVTGTLSFVGDRAADNQLLEMVAEKQHDGSYKMNYTGWL